MGVVVIAVRKKTTPTLSSTTIRVPNFKNSDQRFWLAEVEKISPGFIKLSAFNYQSHYSLHYALFIQRQIEISFYCQILVSLLHFFMPEKDRSFNFSLRLECGQLVLF